MNELHYQLDLLKAMNQKLSAKDKMHRMICDASNCAFLYHDFEKNEVFTTGKWKDYFSFEVQDIKELTQMFDEMEDSCVMELRNLLFLEKCGQKESTLECRHKNGKQWYRFHAIVDYDHLGTPSDKLIIIENITRNKIQNEELIYMAHYDAMTGLYNRNYYISLLGDLLKKAEAENNIVSVMVVDIDEFKKVNDGLGMIVGDELIQIFGSFLKELSSENVLVCHLNNDVYCIAIYDPSGSRSVEHIHRLIQERTRTPFQLSDGKQLDITVSVGVAEYPEAAASSIELINCAEIVMFYCKKQGKDSIRYYDTSILKDFHSNIEMEDKLKEALYDNRFEMYYQPLFYTGNKKLRGMEALIRLRDTDGTLISPAKFIPVAEKNGSIISIGNWVVDQTIKQYATWKKKYGIPFCLSVNISAVHCKNKDFVANLKRVVTKYQVSPKDIEIEITESVLIDDFDLVADKLKEIKAFGIKISLDDFGTGYSSLSYLKEFPIDTLKIDKSFIDTSLSDGATRVILEMIIQMVKKLGIESIAEGVEKEAQYQYLHAIGCEIIQGYYFGKPMSVEDMDKLLTQIS